MIYLDNGATSFPKPRAVHEAYSECMHRYAANAGRGAHRLSVMAAEKIWETRADLATLFHVEAPERIIFTQNCTDGINLALKGILKGGDDVVISDMEHNSVYRPCIAMQTAGVRTLFARSEDDGTVTEEAVLRAITPRTRLVCLQHASNVGGGINPIREIGRLLRGKGILFMVDAAQTAGCVPIDAEADGIDILAFPGHKGLLGPQGTGGLYVREGIPVRTLREGGTGGASESPYMPEFLPDRLESGTVNLPGIAGLGGGVRFILKNGVEKIEKHENALAAYFIRKIREVPGIRILGPRDMKKRTAVISVAAAGMDAAAVAEKLDQRYGIAVRAGLHCAPLAAKRFGIMETGSVRFSPGIFNSVQEMEYAANAFRKIVQK